MITSKEQLEQWMAWIEEGDTTEALRAIQHNIDKDGAGPELVERAREFVRLLRIEADDLQVDDDAAKSETDDGTWVQAWIWLPVE